MEISPPDLPARAAEARRRLAVCDLCALECRADRAAGQRGPCGVGAQSTWFDEMVIYGIELELIPAHAIYMAGCNIRCAYCNVARWNAAPEQGRPWDAAAMAARVAQRRTEGARTLLLLGGEPTVHLPALLEMLAALPEPPPVAWDSNMLFSQAARDLLAGVVEVYVADYKFGNDACARAVAGVDDYLEVTEKNLRFAESTARLIVRHLMLPGHLECCTLPVLRRLPKLLERPRLSLRFEYLPPQSALPESWLRGSVTQRDYEAALDAARQFGIELVE